jgi:hypothetical protein
MLYRTRSEALKETSFVSWRTVVIYQVTLPDGRRYFRTTTFDSTRHKCKRCRNASFANSRPRCASTGHHCTICGNPFAGFCGRTAIRSRTTGQFEELPHAWGRSGKLH